MNWSSSRSRADAANLSSRPKLEKLRLVNDYSAYNSAFVSQSKAAELQKVHLNADRIHQETMRVTALHFLKTVYLFILFFLVGFILLLIIVLLIIFFDSLKCFLYEYVYKLSGKRPVLGGEKMLL